MKNRIIYLIILLISIGVGCEKDKEIPDFSQPFIQYQVDENTFYVGDTTIVTGPEKDYENDSKVVLRIVVASDRKLSRFTVSTSSDAFSQKSKVIKTEPVGAIDENGDFTMDLKEVVVYYAYHIHPLTKAGTNETITLAVFNEKNNTAAVNYTFHVLKKGSTNGTRLNVIDLSWTNVRSNGIGNQDHLYDETGGTRPVGKNVDYRGPLFAFNYGFGFERQMDALAHADEIDFVGYRTRYAGTDPVITNGRFYLCSPSDTTVLNTDYKGVQAAGFQITGTGGSAEISFAGITGTATFRSNVNNAATDFFNAYKAQYKEAGYTLTRSGAKLIWKQDRPVGTITDVTYKTISGDLAGHEESTQNIIFIKRMRTTMRMLGSKLASEGKELRVVYFKRLDDIEGPNKVTPEDFDVLTHDNEFDTLLEGIEDEGVTHIGPMALDEVYGFVMSDGKRGLLRTSPPTVFFDGSDQAVPAPNAGRWKLHGIIKYQKN